jgi:hypothetical protein
MKKKDTHTLHVVVSILFCSFSFRRTVLSEKESVCKTEHKYIYISKTTHCKRPKTKKKRLSIANVIIPVSAAATKHLSTNTFIHTYTRITRISFVDMESSKRLVKDKERKERATFGFSVKHHVLQSPTPPPTTQQY